MALRSEILLLGASLPVATRQVAKNRARFLGEVFDNRTCTMLRRTLKTWLWCSRRVLSKSTDSRWVRTRWSFVPNDLPLGLDFSSAVERGVDKTVAADGDEKQRKRQNSRCFVARDLARGFLLWRGWQKQWDKTMELCPLKSFFRISGQNSLHRPQHPTADRRCSLSPITMGRGSEVREGMNHCSDPCHLNPEP